MGVDQETRGEDGGSGKRGRIGQVRCGEEEGERRTDGPTMEREERSWDWVAEKLEIIVDFKGY